VVRQHGKSSDIERTPTSLSDMHSRVRLGEAIKGIGDLLDSDSDRGLDQSEGLRSGPQVLDFLDQPPAILVKSNRVMQILGPHSIRR
jgi:hypothetical protein